MPIVPSRARRIQELIRGLGSERAADRESAVAQLTLLGPRVVEALLRALPTAGPATRLAALEVLERLRETRALPEIVALAQSADTNVARRALEVLGAFPVPRAAMALARILESAPAPLRRAAVCSLVRYQAAGMVEATDPLLDVLMDEREDDELRLFVLDSLAALDPPLDSRTLLPLLERLQGSTDPTVADRAASLKSSAAGSRPGGIAPSVPLDARPDDAEALERELERSSDPKSVGPLADALGRVGRPSSLPVLARALERLSRPDDDERVVIARAVAKGRVHLALAALDSRLALFDLREMLQARPVRALPSLLEAAARVGDASVVPALVALAAESRTLVDLCAGPFASIVRRARLRPTSAALKAVRPAHREALRELWERSSRSSAPATAGRKAPRKR
jgi:eukaryotic-like serine/threonine-protein kinase